MYKGFIIDDFSSTVSFVSSQSIKESVFLSNRQFELDLKKFLFRDDVDRELILDGSKLSQECFPKVKADIFISHSHKDIDEVREFAKHIYLKTGLVSFIDSEVWKYADDLLKELDSLCTFNDETELYDYNQRNISTSYVHLMLNTALLNMIDNCECLFFLNTPNSFNVEDEIKDTTYSPWIYSELSMANNIEKKIPKRYEELKKSLQEGREALFSQLDSGLGLKIALKPSINNLIQCDYGQIRNWLKSCSFSSGKENLDLLYETLASQPQTKRRIY